MTTTPINLTGYVTKQPEITDTFDSLMEIPFQLVHSPTDAAVDDTTLSCVLRDARLHPR